MKTATTHQTKTHLSRLLERAHEGEEIILAKAGKPYYIILKLNSLKDTKMIELI